MFNKEIMINAVVALGFTYSGKADSTGVCYEGSGHVVNIFNEGMVHIKPNGQRKFYYSDASPARIRAALVKSLAYYKNAQ